MSQDIKLSWGAEQRIEFIEFRLLWEGKINRKDIVKVFNVSVPQASKDLNLYESIAPGNLIYDKSKKCYLASPKFKPRFLRPDPDTYFLHLKGIADGTLRRSDSWLDTIPVLDIALTPKRRIEIDVLRIILDVVRQKKSVEILYQSMSDKSPDPSWRRITPHAFGYDGFRWHTRAYCHTNNQFRDFLLSRMLDTRNIDTSGMEGERDKFWNEYFEIKIAPHPKLTESQKSVVAKDYSFLEGSGILSVRHAMLFYVLKRLGLRPGAEKEDPKTQHIIALNIEEANEAVRSARNTTF